MDIRKIKKLIELVEESGINELEISEGEESVRISRGVPAGSMPMMPMQMALTTLCISLQMTICSFITTMGPAFFPVREEALFKILILGSL